MTGAIMGEIQLLAEVFNYAVEHQTFNKAVAVQKAKNVCCFGLGTYFKEAFVSKKLQEKWHVNLLSDNDASKWGKTFCGLPCVSPEEMKRYDDLAVIILLGNPRPVQKQLREMGIWHVTHVDLSIDDELGFTKDIKEFAQTRDKYLEAYSMFEDDESKQIYVNALINRVAPEKSLKSWDEMCTGNEYFGQPFMQNVLRGDTFIDCGAWTGDTVRLFSDYVDGDYKCIHAFELDEENCRALRKNTEGMHDVVVHHAGVGDKNEIITYSIGSGENEPTDGISLMKQGGEMRSAEIVRLDDVLENEGISFIKMDIEGSETSALRGAKALLRQQKPQLAVCVYHKTSDFWEIPFLIRETNPNYKLYLRHHYNRNCWGTVLYGV